MTLEIEGEICLSTIQNGKRDRFDLLFSTGTVGWNLDSLYFKREIINSEAVPFGARDSQLE